MEEDWVGPNPPMEAPPNVKESPVCAPERVLLAKGLSVKGLVAPVLVCRRTDGDPNGLLGACPSAVT